MASVLSPNDKSANGNLGGDYLTFTSTSGRSGVRSIAPIISLQKCYFEVLVNSVSAGITVGVANVLESLTANPGVGIPTNASAVGSDGIYRDQSSANSGATAFTPSVVAGNVICIAFDNAGSPKASFRVNGGLWNNSATGDPATATDVFDVVITGRPLYVIISVAGPGDSVTARLASTSWSVGAPSGFTELAGSGAPADNLYVQVLA